MGEAFKKLKRASVGNKWFNVLAGIAIVLMVTSFFLPPTGKIDEGAFKFAGWCFAFAALRTLIKALDSGVDAKLRKGDASIEIINDSDASPEEQEYLPRDEN